MENEKVWPEGGRLNLKVPLIKTSLHLGIQTQLDRFCWAALSEKLHLTE